MKRGVFTRRQRGFTIIELMVVVVIIAILSGLMISASSRPYGANAKVVSEQLTTMMNFARLRASATRKTQRVRITPTAAYVESGVTTGLTLPATWDPVPIQQITWPNTVVVWDVTAGAAPTAASGTEPTAANSGLNVVINFRPDGQASPSSTIWVTDTAESWKYRVIVYHVTGGVYSRQYW